MASNRQIDPYKVVEYIKQVRPNEVMNMSDYDIFEYSKGALPSYRDNFNGVENPFDIAPRVETFEDLTSKSKQERASYTIPKSTFKKEEDADYSPESFSFLEDFSLSETLKDGGFGMPPEYYQQAYNESFAGMTYAINNGKFKYDVDDYEPGILGEVGQMVLGIADPLGVASLFTGGIVGKGVQKVGSRLLLNKFAQKNIESFAKNKIGKVASQVFTKEALDNGFRFGGYTAAAGYLSSASEQAVDPEGDGTFNKWEATKSAIAHGAEGIALGSITGIGNQTIASKFAKNRWAKNPSMLKRASNKIAEKTSQIGAEATAFTSLPYIFHDEARPESFEDFGRQLATNVGLVSVMKGAGALLNRSKNNIDDIKSKRKFDADIEDKYENIKNKLIGSVDDITPEQTNLITQGLNRVSKKVKDIDDVLPDLEKEFARVNELINKKTPLTIDENAELVYKTQTGLDAMAGVYKTLLDDESIVGGLSPKDKALYKASIKQINTFKKEANERATSKIERDDVVKAQQPEVETKPTKEPSITLEQKVKDMTDDEVIAAYGRLKDVSPSEAKQQLLTDTGTGSSFLDIEGARNQLLAPDVRTEDIIKGVTKGVASKLGIFTEPQKKRDINIKGDRYKALVKTTDDFQESPQSQDYLQEIQSANNNISKLSDDKLVQVAVDNTLKKVKAKKGNTPSPNTIESYGNTLTGYVKYLNKNDIDITQATAEQIFNFMKTKSGNISPSKAAPMKIMYSWMSSPNGFRLDTNEGEWLEEVFRAYNKKAQVRQKTLPSFAKYTQEIDKIVNKFDKISPENKLKPVYEKAKTILEVQNQTGIRVQEWRTQRKDVDDGIQVKHLFHLDDRGNIVKGLKEGKINFIDITAQASKNGRQRYVPLTPNSSSSLQSLISSQNLKGSDLIYDNKFRDKIASITNKELKNINEKAVSDDARDILQQVGMFKSGLDHDEIRLLNNMLDHQITRIDVIYGKDVNPSQIIKDTYKAVLKVEKNKYKDTLKDDAGEALDRLTEAGTLGGNANFYKKSDSEYTFRQKLDDALLVASEVIRKGAKNFKNFSVEMIKKLGNAIKPQLSKLFNSAKKYIKDYIDDPKIGLGIKDVSKGSKKPKAIKTIDEIQFKAKQKEVKEKFDEALKKVFPNVKGKIMQSEKRDILSAISDIAKLENRSPSSIASLGYDDLVRLTDAFSQKWIENAVKKKNVVKWMRTYGDIDKLRLAANIGNNEQISILKSLGIKDGLIKNAELSDLHTYYDFIIDANYPQYRKKSWIYEHLADEKFNMDDVKSVDTSKGRYFLVNIEKKLIMAGFQGLRDKLFEHVNKEIALLGEFGDVETNIVNILGGIPKEQRLTAYKGLGAKGRRRFNEIKDDLLLAIDTPRRLEQQELGKLSEKQTEFFKQIYDSKGKFKNTPEAEAVQEINKFFVKVKSDVLGAIKETMNEAQYMDWKSKYHIKWLNDGTYATRQYTKEFLSEASFHEKKIELEMKERAEALAYSRAKRKYGKNPNVDEKFIAQKALEEEYDNAYADVLADFFDSADFTTPRISNRFVKPRAKVKSPEYWENADGKEIKVHEDSWDAVIKYAISMAKYVPTVQYLPEYANIPGFKVRGVKKDLGKLKKGLKSEYTFNLVEDAIKDRIGMNSKQSFMSFLDKTLANFTQFLAKTQLSGIMSGIKNSLLGLSNTAIGAKDVKTFIQGAINTFDKANRRTLESTGLKEVGLKHIDEQISIIEDISTWLTGKPKTLGDKPINKISDAIFFLGGMRQSENFTRYLSANVAQIELNDMDRILAKGRNNPKFKFDKNETVKSKELKKLKKPYQNVLVRLENFYKIPKGNIELLEKYGMTGASYLPDTFENAKIKRKMKDIYNQLITASHIYTQGSSLELFQPQIFNKPTFKYGALYQKMSLHALSNMSDHIRTAHKLNTISPLLSSLKRVAVIGATAYGTGKALMAIENYVFGVDPPTENSSFWEEIAITLWRGEMGATLSEVFNPEAEVSFYTPALVSTAGVVAKQVAAVVQDEAFLLGTGQALDKTLRSIFAAYNQSMKLIERKNNDYNRGVIKYNKLYRKHIKQLEADAPLKQMEKTTMDKYYTDFKIAFNQGTDKEFAKQWVLTWKAKFYEEMDMYKRLGMAQNIAFPKAVKDTDALLERMLTNLNPNKATVYNWHTKKLKKLGIKKLGIINKYYNDFLTDEQIKEIKKLESQYAKKRDRWENKKTGLKREYLQKYLLEALERN